MKKKNQPAGSSRKKRRSTEHLDDYADNSQAVHDPLAQKAIEPAFSIEQFEQGNAIEGHFEDGQRYLLEVVNRDDVGFDDSDRFGNDQQPIVQSKEAEQRRTVEDNLKMLMQSSSDSNDASAIPMISYATYRLHV